jgi:hypothetical protein
VTFTRGGTPFLSIFLELFDTLEVIIAWVNRFVEGGGWDRAMSTSLTPPPNPRPSRGERAALKKDVDMALGLGDTSGKVML